MSLRKLLDSHTRGMPISVGVNKGVYDEEGDGVDFDSLDIVDQQAYVEEKRQQYEYYEAKYKAEQKAAKQKEKALTTIKPLSTDNSASTDDPTAEDTEKKGGKGGK